FDTTVDFALYSWNGQSTSAPVQLTVNLTGLSVEGIAIVPASLSGTFQIQLISDKGSDTPYGDATEQKDITTLQYRRFVSSVVNVSGVARMASAGLIPVNESANVVSLTAYPNPVVSMVTLEFEENVAAPSKYLVYTTEGLLVKEIAVSANGNTVNLDLSGLE